MIFDFGQLLKIYRTRFVLVALLLALLYPRGAIRADSSSWSSHGPPGASIAAVTIAPGSPTVVYSASEDGSVFRSLDAGASWSQTAAGLPESSWNHLVLAVHPQVATTLYLGTQEGIFKSTDGGVTWLITGYAGKTLYALVIDPHNPETLYAGSTWSGIWKSTDGGTTWSNPTLKSTFVWSLAQSAGAPGTLYAGTAEGVYKSTNAGTIWQNLNPGFKNVQALAVAPTDPKRVYAGTYNGVYRSTDGGTSWSAAGLAAYRVEDLVVDPANPAVVYAAVLGLGVYKSINAGGTWTLMSSPEAIVMAVSLAVSPTSSARLYAGGIGGSGVLTTANGGVNWQVANNGINAANVSLAVTHPLAPDMVYAVSQMHGPYKSGDRGWTWAPAGAELPGPFVGALGFDTQQPTTVYAGTAAGPYKSTNGGASWSPANGGLPAIAIDALVVQPANPSTLYAGSSYTAGSPGIYRSTDAGLSWQSVNAGLTDKQAHVLAIPSGAPDVVYAGTETGVYKSVGGVTWTAATFGLPAARVYDLVVHPTGSATLYAALDKAGVFKTTDGGGHWAAASAGLPNLDVRALAINPTNPEQVYAGTYGAGVFRSSDGGRTWLTFNPGLTNLKVQSLAFDPGGALYAGTRGGGLFAIEIYASALVINYPIGGPGSYFLITGCGFPPNALVTVTINGVTLGTLRADGMGCISLILVTPQASPGYYVVALAANAGAAAAALGDTSGATGIGSAASAIASVSFAIAEGQPVRPQQGTGATFAVPAGIAYTHRAFVPLSMR